MRETLSTVGPGQQGKSTDFNPGPERDEKTNPAALNIPLAKRDEKTNPDNHAKRPIAEVAGETDFDPMASAAEILKKAEELGINVRAPAANPAAAAPAPAAPAAENPAATDVIAKIHRTTAELAEIAQQIATHTAELIAITKKGLPHWIEIGRLFTRAKEIGGHGNFGKWCNDNTSYSQTSVKRFMRIYQHGEFLRLSKGPEMDLLTIATADEEISKATGKKGSRKGKGKKGIFRKTPEEKRREIEEEEQIDREKGLLTIDQQTAEGVYDPADAHDILAKAEALGVLPQEVISESKVTPTGPAQAAAEAIVAAMKADPTTLAAMARKSGEIVKNLPGKKQKTPEERAIETLVIFYQAVDTICAIDPKEMKWDGNHLLQLGRTMNKAIERLINWNSPHYQP